MTRSSLVARQAEVKEAKKAAKKAWVGPKKGSQVRIMRPESYWFQQRGTVVNVNQKTNIKQSAQHLGLIPIRSNRIRTDKKYVGKIFVIADRL
eukprot:6007609-Amphidinium_carterae.1